MLKVYTALSVIGVCTGDLPDNSHITMSFSDPCETRPLNFSDINDEIEAMINLSIVDVVYWPAAKVTVLLVNKEPLLPLFNRLADLGYKYSEYEWTPHITVAYGPDKTGDWRHVIGNHVIAVDLYLRFKDFKGK